MSPPPDTFHVIRDCRALFLKLLGALLQESSQLSAAAIGSIQHGAGAYFDEMVTSKRRGGFKEEAHGLTSSRITLVCEDDLELGIRLDNLSARLFESTGGDLWRIHLRFATLLQRPDLAKTSIPVGPKGICQGLDEMFAAADATGIDKKLQQLDRIEETLEHNLPALYTEINAFLEHAGVEAAQPAIVSAPENIRRPTPEAPVLQDNALLALQRALLAHRPGRPSSAPAGGPAAALLSQAAIERLIFRLNDLEHHGNFAAQLPPDSAPSLEALIPGLFSESETSGPAQPAVLNAEALGIPAAAPQGLAIDTLVMIFGALSDNPTLPDALKAIISSLQITFLKLAIQDPGLFADTAHPSRLLLDRMGVAVLGLPVDVPARHPICARLSDIAGQLRRRYTGDGAVFKEAVAEIDALIAERHGAIVGAAQAYIPLLNQMERRDLAGIQSRLTVDKVIERGVPEPIREFLDDTWRRVLQLVWLEYGPNSSQWQDHTAVIDNLLWTFQAKSGAEDRKVLARRLPEILKQIKAGMERLGIAADAQATFFDTCFSLQTQALRTPSVAGESPERPLPAPSTRHLHTGKMIAGEVEAGSLLLRTLDFSLSRPPSVRPLPCQAGDWLEIRLDGDETCVAHLCHISPKSQRALFCNPDSKLALAIHPAILDKQLREGQARVLSSLSLFDAAAERALGRSMTP